MWSPGKTAEQRAAKKRSSAFVLLNLWPFAAIMVVLVGIFMARYMPVVDYGGPATDLPTIDHAVAEGSANREDAIRILVTRDGGTYINRKSVRLDDLAKVVQSAVRDGAQKKVYISADARAKNGDIERVVDEIRRAGITQIAFLTEQR
jgi:biopolymer transport protein TolR